MPLLHTPTKDSSFYAAPFSLRDVSGKTLSFDDIKGKNGALIMFICNHCPYVKAVIDRLVADCRELQEAGIGCVAIMPNDTVSHPDDSFENMQKFAKKHGFTFPYLIDETQASPGNMTPSAPPTFSASTPKAALNIAAGSTAQDQTPPMTAPSGNCATPCCRSRKPAPPRQSSPPLWAAPSSGNDLKTLESASNISNMTRCNKR